MNQPPTVHSRSCTICGSTDDLTVEHIIPQALLRAWGIGPNEPDWKRFRTTLCRVCNDGTASLHKSAEMLSLILTGAPVSRIALGQLADWSVWVTMLLGVSRCASIWPIDAARKHLTARFATRELGGIPKGTVVYVALADDESTALGANSYAIARRDDPNVEVDYRGDPVGFRSAEYAFGAAHLRVGELCLLVVAPTWSSGPGHRARMDAAAASGGFVRIHPPAAMPPHLLSCSIAFEAIGKLFVSEPLIATDWSLLPERIREVLAAFTT